MIPLQTKILAALLTGLIAIVGGCAPATFQKTNSVEWQTVPFKPDLTRDRAWDLIVDTVAREMGIEILDKENGYLRTAWTYAVSGNVQKDYRARLIVKIPASNDRVNFKTIAQWYDGGKGSWVNGYDAVFTDQIYSDLLGRIGKMEE